MLRFDRKQQNSVKQLSFNKNRLIKKKQTNKSNVCAWRTHVIFTGEGAHVMGEVQIQALTVHIYKVFTFKTDLKHIWRNSDICENRMSNSCLSVILFCRVESILIIKQMNRR